MTVRFRSRPGGRVVAGVYLGDRTPSARVTEGGRSTLPAEAGMTSTAAVRPGDTLLVGLSAEIGPDLAKEIAARLESQLPGVAVVIIRGVTSMSAYRPGPG